MPMYYKNNYKSFENAKKLSETGLSLPSGSGLILTNKKSQWQLIIF